MTQEAIRIPSAGAIFWAEAVLAAGTTTPVITPQAIAGAPPVMQVTGLKVTSDIVALQLTGVAQASLPDTVLPAGAFPLGVWNGFAKLVPATGAAPAQYAFVDGEPIIYVNQSGASFNFPKTAFAS